MIIKNFLTKLSISKYFYILVILCFITGLIKEILAIFILVIFHEFGHYLISYIYKWNIKKIVIYPFGGIIKYDELIDKPFLEELLITITGPINQLFIFFVFYLLNNNYLISDYFFNIVKQYNIGMLFFNLLPIIPLDGSKLLNIFFNSIFNYKISYILLYIVSIISFLNFFIYEKNNYSYMLLFSFLIYEIVNYIKNSKIMSNRFILEKYLFENKYKRRKNINNINKMMRNKKHLIKINNIYFSEKEAIKKIKGV